MYQFGDKHVKSHGKCRINGKQNMCFQALTKHPNTEAFACPQTNK